MSIRFTFRARLFSMMAPLASIAGHSSADVIGAPDTLFSVSSGSEWLADALFFGGPPGEVTNIGCLLVSTADYPGSFLFWRCLPSGTIVPAGSVTGQSWYGPVTGDYDGDGYDDLLRGWEGTTGYLTHFNQDGYQLMPQVLYPAVQAAFPMAAADFDGDGDEDCLCTVGPGLVTLWTSLGDGQYVEQIVTTPTGATGVVPADFDSDGDIDFAAMREDSRLNVYLNGGSGAFTLSAVYGPLPGGDGLVTADDFDGDGDTDIATWCSSSSSPPVVVFLNDGDAAFSPGQGSLPGLQSARIASADFDMDGHSDLASWHDRTLTVFEGLGDGTFGSPLGSIGDAWSAVFAHGDFDGDGDPDLAWISNPSYYEYVLLAALNPTVQQGVGDPAGADEPSALSASANPFSESVLVFCPGGPVPASVAVMDLDGRVVRRLWPVGAGVFDWDGRFADGREAPPGIYIVAAGAPGAGASLMLTKL